MSILAVHLYVAYAVAILAVFAVWRRPERRIALYVLTLQIVLGIAVIVAGLRAPSLHYALAVLGWAGYMVANAVGRRPGRERAGLAIAVLSSALLLWAFYLGMHAVKTGG